MTSTLPSLPPPLDETVFSQPALLQEWGGLNTDNILFYFSFSPFYDPTSNNAITTTQAQFNPALAPILQSRQAFEAHLRSMAGLEFVVAHDPTAAGSMQAKGRTVLPSVPPAALGQEIEGAWVIRKQRRIKDARREDSVEVLAEYFCVGDRLFQAPSLGAVLGKRMLSIAKSLQEIVEKAGSVAEFTAARGHGYKNTSSTTTVKDQGGSVVGSPTAAGVALVDDSDADEDEKADAALLMETLMNHAAYGKMYMDENPLVGEPGNFRVSKNGTEVPLRAPINPAKNAILPTLTVKTDLASVVAKKEKGNSAKSPVSATTAGGTKKKKKDRRGQTPKEPKTPAAS